MSGSSRGGRPADGSRRRDGADEVAIGLVAVFLLSTLAGAVDAYGLSILKDLFVSFMSGNTTSLGVALGAGDLARAGLIASIVAAFTAGAAAGGMLAILLGRYHLPGVVAVVALLLALPILVPEAAVLLMTFAMGVLNAAIDKAGNVGVSITYVTGALAKLGRGLGEWLCRRQRDLVWLEQGVPWLGLLGGAALATVGLARNRPATILALPAAAAVLSCAFLAVTARRVRLPSPAPRV